MAPNSKTQPDIILYGSSHSPPTYVWSPFVSKLEARLRFSKVSYRNEDGSPFAGPRGKIPFIKISTPESEEPPTKMGDSTLIIKKLVEDGVMEDLNKNLTLVEKAHDLALRALLEDKLYWYQVHERWYDNFYTLRAHAFKTMWYPFQVIIGLIAYRAVMKWLYGQGTGRFSASEIGSFREEIWESLEALLAAPRRNAKKDETFWILGRQGPSEADAVLYGFVVSVLICDANPELQKVVRSLPVVMEYAKRIHQRFFPDYEFWDDRCS